MLTKEVEEPKVQGGKAKLDHVLVSQHSRDQAHSGPANNIDRLKKEFDQLRIEKKELERQMSEAEDYRRTELAKGFNLSLSRTEGMRRTTELEAKVREMKSPIKKALVSVEERLNAIKPRIKSASSQAPERVEMVQRDLVQVKILEVLLRIEKHLAAKD